MTGVRLTEIEAQLNQWDATAEAWDTQQGSSPAEMGQRDQEIESRAPAMCRELVAEVRLLETQARLRVRESEAAEVLAVERMRSLTW